MIQWARFASKAKGLRRKAKAVAKYHVNYAKAFPKATATAAGIGGLTGLGAASIINSKKKKNGK